MNRLGFWLADKLALALEPHERDALQGDHAELGASGLQAAWDVGGLVARRQLEPWKGWRPWFVLVTLVLPFTLLVTVSLNLGEAFSRFGLLGESSPLPQLLLLLPGVALTTALWCWSCNFTLAALSGRRAFVNQTVFWLLAVLYVGSGTRNSLSRDADPTQIAFEILAFVVVFAIPSLTGLRAGRVGISPSGPVCASLVIAPAAVMALLWGIFPSDPPEVFLFLGLTWPAIWICSRRYFGPVTSH